MEDQSIIKLFFARSERAIRELDVQYGRLCRRLAANILQNEQDVEECVNDAYLAVWNRIPPEKPDPLASYVCRIVKNVSCKRQAVCKAKKRDTSYDIALAELEECLVGATGVEDALLAKELSAHINYFLEKLTQGDRILFVRRYWFGDSVKDIASMQQMSGNHVTVRLHRIRKRLKKYLEMEGLL